MGGGSGVLSIVSSIVANNTVLAGGTGPDVRGNVTASFSLIRDPSGATITNNGGNLIGINPMLGPLADKGGPILTHALLVGSPAIDAGTASYTHLSQPVLAYPPGSYAGPAPDLGAYETVSPP